VSDGFEEGSSSPHPSIYNGLDFQGRPWTLEPGLGSNREPGGVADTGADPAA
jgi:hypothetical protein